MIFQTLLTVKQQHPILIQMFLDEKKVFVDWKKIRNKISKLNQLTLLGGWYISIRN